MTEPAKLPEPWERQAGESEEAWLAFRAYRDMAPDERVLKRAAAVRLTTLSKWFRDHNWDDRCKAYDAHFDKMRVDEREKVYRRAAREIAIDHMIVLSDARELVAREFGKLVEASRASEMHGLIKPETLVKMAETMVKLDRLVRGESTENVGVKNAIDISKLSLDEVRVLNELLEKAEAADEGEDHVPSH